MARVAWTSGTYFTIDGGNNVTSTAAATYTATAWVKAAPPPRSASRSRSSCASAPPAGATVADVGSASVPLSSSWQQLTVQRTTAAGNRRGAPQPHLGRSGNAIYADAFTSLDRGGRAPAPQLGAMAAFTFTPASPQTGQSVTFTDGSTDCDGTIASRAWDTDNDGAFDDGTGTTAARTFTSAAPTRCAAGHR